MSFDRKHRRQVSNAAPKFEAEDEDDRASEAYAMSILQIKRKLDQISDVYKVNISSFNPLEQVIEMMKSSQPKERKKELDANVRTLDRAMEDIVKSCYDGFNTSIKNYTQILSCVTETANNNLTLQDYSDKCHTLFTSRSHSVNTMYLQSLEYTYMIEILDKIEAIKTVPDRFQTALGHQEYTKAATILVEAVDQLYQDDLLRIGALVELQSDIVGKRNSFHETCVELLHNLLYAKDETELEEVVTTTVTEVDASRRYLAGLRQLDQQDRINLKLDLMNQLVSALFVLGKSGQAINKILERLRGELRHLIQKAVALVKKDYEKDPVLLQQITSRPPRGPTSNNSTNASNIISSDYPNLFLKMLQFVFSHTLEILEFHKYLTSLFEQKIREQQQQLDPDSQHDGSYSDDETERNGPSNSSPLGTSSSSSTYSLDHVWDEFQLEIQSLLSYFIQSPSESPASSTGSKSKSKSSTEAYTQAGNSSRLFTFANSSAYTLYEVSEAQSFQYSNMDLGEPSPYNLSSLFPLITDFCSLALQIVGDSSNTSRLQQWLDSFIISVLLPKLKDDYRVRVTALSMSAEAFKPRDSKLNKLPSYTTDESRRPLINSSIEMYQCIKELSDDTVAMPNYASSIHNIMETSLSTYIDYCKKVFDDVLRDTEVSRTVRDTEFQRLVLTDPNWKRIMRLYKIGGSSSSMPNSLTLTSSIGLEDSSSNLESSQGDVPVTQNNPQSNGKSPTTSPIVASGSAPSLTRSMQNNFNSTTNNGIGGGSGTTKTGLARTPISNSELGNASSAFDKEEKEYFANIMDLEAAWHTGTTDAGLPILVKHMIYVPSKISTLASLHDSLFWLADKISTLDKTEIIVQTSNTSSQITSVSGPSQTNIPNSVVSGASGSGSASKRPYSEVFSSNVTSGSGSDGSTSKSTSLQIARSSQNIPANAISGFKTKLGRANLFRNSSKDQLFKTSKPKFSSSLNNFTWMLKDLSDQCLLSIYVDFRLQTCYFLDGIDKNYSFAIDDRIADQKVTALNDSLTNAANVISLFMPATKLKYLLASLPTLMSVLLIESLKYHIEAINRNGVAKMIRNIFALQQNLTNIVTFNEDPFDKVRRYYELLNLTPEEIYSYISQHHYEDSNSYTLNQFRTLLELVLNPKSRSLSDEQEKELREKYMLI